MGCAHNSTPEELFRRHPRSEALTPATSTLFVEGLCMQPDAAGCLHKLNNSKEGLKAIQTLMRMDTSPDFMNGLGTQILTYFQHPGLKDLDGGRYLQRIVTKVGDPPIFWDAFVDSFKGGKLQESATFCFAWLLLQLVSLPGDEADPYRPVAQDTTLVNSLVASRNNDIRTIAHKIRRIVGVLVTGDHGPGGRYDMTSRTSEKSPLYPLPTKPPRKNDPTTEPATNWTILRPSTLGKAPILTITFVSFARIWSTIWGRNWRSYRGGRSVTEAG